ncbi:hypothetical protein D3C80_1263080 [compost metagenome]
MRGVGDRRVAEQRFVDGGGTTTDEGPAVLDEFVGDTQVMAAGALEADHVPVLDDLDLAGREHRRARFAARRTGADADTQQVRAFAAAGELPGAVDLPAAFHRLGWLQREQPAGEHQVRTLGVDFSQGLRWQGRQIDTGAAEAGDPARRAVGFGDAFDHVQEQRRRQGVAAVAFRRGGAIDTQLLEALDHVPRHVGAGVEFFAALANLIQHLLK